MRHPDHPLIIWSPEEGRWIDMRWLANADVDLDSRRAVILHPPGQEPKRRPELPRDAAKRASQRVDNWWKAVQRNRQRQPRRKAAAGGSTTGASPRREPMVALVGVAALALMMLMLVSVAVMAVAA